MRRFILLVSVLFSAYVICSCGEWVPAEVGFSRCSFDSFLEPGHKPLRAFARNNGRELFILDDWSTISRYRRNGISECAWDLDYSWKSGGRLWASGFPEDISSSDSDVFWSSGGQIYSEYGTLCSAERGAFAVSPYGSSIITGSSGGTKIWSMYSNGCSINWTLSYTNTLAVAQDDYGFYAVEASGKIPQTLVLYNRNGDVVWREPLSILDGGEKNFCSVTRLISTNAGVYLLDSECNRLGVLYNNGLWKTIELGSYNISKPLDIMAAEYSYIYVLTSSQVVKINARY